MERSHSDSRHRPVTARAPAPRAPGDEVRALQRAIGNAAMGRLVARRRRVLARFGEPEHKATGDKALPDVRWRLRKAGVPFDNPFTDFQLTFGDWVALGDWFEDVNEIREMLRPDGKGKDRIGQLYYALFAKIRLVPNAERLGGKDGGLWTEEDKQAVDMRYQVLKTRNIKHFPNPEVGDTRLSTAAKARRARGGKPFGAVAHYHQDHLEAIKIAITAAHVPDESRLGEALAVDGFACHFLTDAFSGSHARTPRASIEEHWDKKVPKFHERLGNWLADEAAFVVVTRPTTEILEKGFWEGLFEPGLAPLVPGAARDAVRKKIRPQVPPLSFGDIVGLVVHDWEGAHGPHRHGPLVEVAGRRFRLAGDDDILPAVAKMQNVNTDAQLRAVLDDRKRSHAERTFAGASLAVRASVNDVYRAFELARKDTNRARIIRKLTGKDGLFAAERLLPGAVPDAELPAEDRMPKWDYATVDELLRDPKIREALPMSAARVGGPFEDTLATLDAPKAVKDHLRRVLADPLKSGSIPRIVAWLKGVIDYREEAFYERLRERPKREVNDLRQSVGAR